MNVGLETTIEETVEAAETGTNKSQWIRDCVGQNPGAGASEIAAKLAAAGTPVSLPLIYQVLRRSGEKPEKKRRGPKVERSSEKLAQPPAVRAETEKPVVVKPAASSADNLYDAMLQFVEAAGGLSRAINILTILKQ